MPREPTLIFDNECPEDISLIINLVDRRMKHPAMLHNATLLPQWRTEIAARGWVRVENHWYHPDLLRSGAVWRAQARLKEKQAQRARERNTTPNPTKGPNAE